MPLEPFKRDIVKALEDVNLAETFGWTDKYITGELDPARKEIYLAVLRGRSQAGDK